ncbi:hypothetical protein [Sphingomonas astaxanthinifaciens]|uniref:hypothetical protein n=1 Tax=Sphingomonas astaxanthinifaciens TaxID=407019 RepID=UPI0012EB3EA2|nr:hypothetical protein [Sphingomonas astaxanthinifaciens]
MRSLAAPALLGVISIALLSQPASADQLDAAASQRVRVHGTVDGACGMGNGGSADFGELGSGGQQANFKVSLRCNVPFVLKFSAERGALTNRDFPHGQGPYAGSLPYTLDIAIPARRPAPVMLTGMLRSADLLGSQSISSAGAIADQGMDVRVTLGRVDSSAGLLAGNYGETITVTLSPI